MLSTGFINLSYSNFDALVSVLTNLTGDELVRFGAVCKNWQKMILDQEKFLIAPLKKLTRHLKIDENTLHFETLDSCVSLITFTKNMNTILERIVKIAKNQLKTPEILEIRKTLPLKLQEQIILFSEIEANGDSWIESQIPITELSNLSKMLFRELFIRNHLESTLTIVKKCQIMSLSDSRFYDFAIASMKHYNLSDEMTMTIVDDLVKDGQFDRALELHKSFHDCSYKVNYLLKIFSSMNVDTILKYYTLDEAYELIMRNFDLGQNIGYHYHYRFIFELLKANKIDNALNYIDRMNVDGFDSFLENLIPKLIEENFIFEAFKVTEKILDGKFAKRDVLFFRLAIKFKENENHKEAKESIDKIKNEAYRGFAIQQINIRFQKEFSKSQK